MIIVHVCAGTSVQGFGNVPINDSKRNGNAFLMNTCSSLHHRFFSLHCAEVVKCQELSNVFVHDEIPRT